MELVAVVVIPARDEQDHIAGCLRGTRGADRRPGELRDDRRARRLHRRHRAGRQGRGPALRLELTLIEGPATGAGAARRAGMDAAASRLLELGNEHGLIACTDADSRPRLTGWRASSSISPAGQ